ncbi:MAG: M13 family metallopeptidase [Puia sp.]|nr:M13 family metallopeptidase [Puia sp.]
MKKSYFLYSLLLVLSSCQSRPARDHKDPPDFLVDNLDTTIRPSDDFFQYANGGWINRNPIPPGESDWGVAQLVQDDIYRQLKMINDQAASITAPKGSIQQLIGDYWRSGMDTIAIEGQGLKPLQPDLDRIDRIKSTHDFIAVVAAMHNNDNRVLFADDVVQDDKNSDSMVYELQQGGIGMINRDYYFSTDTQSVSVRKAYREYLCGVFRLLGADSARAVDKAAAVFRLETHLAANSRKIAALRIPDENYKKICFRNLSAICPAIDWVWHLKSSGVDNPPDSLIIRQPEFFKALGHELTHTPLEDWKDYLRFHLLHQCAPYLDVKTFNNQFRYYQVLNGVSTPRPRWKRVIDNQEGAMGEALGQIFVKEYFPAGARTRYASLVEEIREAFRERIQKLDWMSEGTRQRALIKLAAIRKKVGYPDKWLDFSAMRIERGPFVLNMQRANQWWRSRKLHQLGKRADRGEWDMTPQTFNAYYLATNNEIVFPAGIFMVPGKKMEELDDAFVYGYAGAGTIGHEITHGFDDEGRQYDENGNLNNWWSLSDEQKFNQKKAFIVRQFNEFNPLDTMHINGEITQGENIADLGGLVIGLDAFKKSAAFKENKMIGGLSPLQRFFLGYAYSWAYEQNAESLAADLITDVHAPPKERVNGPLVNIPEFYEAFHIRPGDKMYRPDSLRVSIW